jgi:hypothetical protein
MAGAAGHSAASPASPATPRAAPAPAPAMTREEKKRRAELLQMRTRRRERRDRARDEGDWESFKRLALLRKETSYLVALQERLSRETRESSGAGAGARGSSSSSSRSSASRGKAARPLREQLGPLPRVGLLPALPANTLNALSSWEARRNRFLSSERERDIERYAWGRAQRQRLEAAVLVIQRRWRGFAGKKRLVKLLVEAQQRAAQEAEQRELEADAARRAAEAARWRARVGQLPAGSALRAVLEQLEGPFELFELRLPRGWGPRGSEDKGDVLSALAAFGGARVLELRDCKLARETRASRVASGAGGSPDTPALCEALSHQTRLEELALDGCGLCARDVEDVFGAIQRAAARARAIAIAAAKASAKGEVEADVGDAADAAVAAPPQTVLTRLDLANNFIARGSRSGTDDCARPAYEACDDGVVALARLLKAAPRIGHLSLANNRMGDRALGVLVRCAFSTPRRVLVSIDLCRCEIGPKGAYSLAHLVSSSLALRRLRAAHNALTARGLQVLERPLTLHKALRHLDLSGNELGDHGAFALGQILRANRALTELCAADNAMSDAGVGELAQAVAALSPHHRLSSLDLSRNRLPGGAEGRSRRLECLRKLAIMLEDCRTLEHVVLQDINMFRPEPSMPTDRHTVLADSLDILVARLRTNNTLRVLDVRNNRLTAPLIQPLAAWVFTNTVLKARPGLRISDERQHVIAKIFVPLLRKADQVQHDDIAEIVMRVLAFDAGQRQVLY